MIIANTTKGKGVSYMEDVTRWHNTMPNKEEIEIARKDLEKIVLKYEDYLDLTRSAKYPFMRDVFIDKIYEEAKKDKDIFSYTRYGRTFTR